MQFALAIYRCFLQYKNLSALIPYVPFFMALHGLTEQDAHCFLLSDTAAYSSFRRDYKCHISEFGT
jgi:hypothetical protein